MKIGIPLVMLCLLNIIFFCCKHKTSSQQDDLSYAKEPTNGLVEEKEVGGIKAVLTYKIWNPVNYSKTNNDAVKYEKNLYFIFSLSYKNKELLKQLQFNQYSEMVQVLAFRMQNFITAYPDNGPPIQPLSCVFEQSYGMGRANNLLIVFDGQKFLSAARITRIRINEFGLHMGDLDYDVQIRNLRGNQTLKNN